MRDDDHSESGESRGKILRSGIRAQAGIEPAGYALPPGTPALQEDPDDWDGSDPRNSRAFSRRHVLSIAIGGVGLGITAFAVGSIFGPDAEGPAPGRGALDASGRRLAPRGSSRTLSGKRLTQEDLRLIDAARQWARSASLETLVDSSPAFLWVFQVVEPDEDLLYGLRRLCTHALNEGGEQGARLAVRLLAAFEHVTAPPGLEDCRDALGEVVWRWEAGKEPRWR
jgi:hypothetical protein